jgi:hypothetical protein
MERTTAASTITSPTIRAMPCTKSVIASASMPPLIV